MTETRKRICAGSTDEYTLCGYAFDAYETGDAEEPVVMAKRGERVTCQQCRAHIDHVRDCFKRYRFVGE